MSAEPPKLSQFLSDQEVLDLFFKQGNGFGSRAFKTALDEAIKAAGSCVGALKKLDEVTQLPNPRPDDAELNAATDIRQRVKAYVVKHKNEFEAALKKAIESKGVEMLGNDGAEQFKVKVCNFGEHSRAGAVIFPGEEVIMGYIDKELKKAMIPRLSAVGSSGA